MPNKDERLEQKAQELFGKPFKECESEERIKVGQHVGGQLKGGEMADPAKAPGPPPVTFGEKNA